MSIKKKVAPKPKTKKVPASVKTKVTMVSYEMGMTIPTGEYANIMPRIVVKAGTMEAAHDFIAPYMNKLWKDYYRINERRVEPSKPVVVTPKPPVVGTPKPPVVGTPKPTQAPVTEPVAVEPAPASSVAMTKATQAIESCMSNDALNLIIDQVEKSVKLTKTDKDLLLPMASEKFEKDFKDKK